ncbi:MAG: hypothetical protein WDN04_23250 [Rhodospirillales bacterium]
MNRAGPEPVLGAEMRAVRRELAGAGDAPRAAGAALCRPPGRPRPGRRPAGPAARALAAAAPVRPLRFARLLFLPLDPLIVSPRDWRLGAPQLPRSAVTPIITLVQAGLPTLLPLVEAAIGDAEQAEATRIRLGGALLWHQAAALLHVAEAPPQWARRFTAASRLAAHRRRVRPLPGRRRGPSICWPIRGWRRPNWSVRSPPTWPRRRPTARCPGACC